MKLRFEKWIVSFLAIALLTVGAAAQTTATDSPAMKRIPTVNIPFFAEDNHGREINDVAASDLSIIDNKNPLRSTLSVRSAKELPLRLGVLIDSSSSVREGGLYRPGLDAMNDLLHQVLNATDDEVFIANFSATMKATEFMGREEFLKSKTNVSIGGGTALFDAVYFACKDRMAADSTQPARRVLVILTDGGDNQSHVTRDEAIIAAQKAGTVIFAVSTNPLGIGDGVLRQFGEKTGGQAFINLRPSDMSKIFRNIREQIENLYVVSYVPQDHGNQGKPHVLELKVTSDKKLKFRAPKEYYPSLSEP